jgi:hypothetical protein
MIFRALNWSPVRWFLSLTTINKFRWFGVFLSALAVLFSIGTYFGIWNYLRGDTLLADLVATRLDLSYAQVSRQVRPGDPEWRPLIRVITKYTRAELPRDRTPVVFERNRAVASAELQTNGNIVAEWTAPTTPILLMYQDFDKLYPVGTTYSVPPKDIIIVGTIGDLHEWIHRDENDFDFLVRNIIFAMLSVCVGVFLALKPT